MQNIGSHRLNVSSTYIEFIFDSQILWGYINNKHKKCGQLTRVFSTLQTDPALARKAVKNQTAFFEVQQSNWGFLNTSEHVLDVSRML